MRNKYNEIASQIKWKINSGIFEPSSKIPSENALAIKYDCSRLTARKALQILKEEGMIVSRQGRGYYVSLGQKKMEYSPLNGKKGEKEKFQIVTIKPSLADLASFKGIGVDIEEIQHNHNFSFMKTQFDENGKPYTVLHSYVNTNKVKGEIGIDEIKYSFSAFLSKRNIVVKKRIERIIVINAPQAISIKLNTRIDALVVAAYSVMFDSSGEVIEFAIRYTIPSEYSETFIKEY